MPMSNCLGKTTMKWPYPVWHPAGPKDLAVFYPEWNAPESGCAEERRLCREMAVRGEQARRARRSDAVSGHLRRAFQAVRMLVNPVVMRSHRLFETTANGPPPPAPTPDRAL